MARLIINIFIILIVINFLLVLGSKSPQCVFSRDPIMCVELSKMRSN